LWLTPLELDLSCLHLTRVLAEAGGATARRQPAGGRAGRQLRREQNARQSRKRSQGAILGPLSPRPPRAVLQLTNPSAERSPSLMRWPHTSEPWHSPRWNPKVRKGPRWSPEKSRCPVTEHALRPGLDQSFRFDKQKHPQGMEAAGKRRSGDRASVGLSRRRRRDLPRGSSLALVSRLAFSAGPRFMPQQVPPCCAASTRSTQNPKSLNPKTRLTLSNPLSPLGFLVASSEETRFPSGKRHGQTLTGNDMHPDVPLCLRGARLMDYFGNGGVRRARPGCSLARQTNAQPVASSSAEC